MTDKEIEFDCVNDIKYVKDTFKEDYPTKDIDHYYIDYSSNCIMIGNRKITSSYTWFGIKEIDSWFYRQIESSKFSKKQLEKMIRRNPHLHNVIKTNLLQNLKYEKQESSH